MKHKSLILSSILAAGLCSCSMIHDDNLEPCRQQAVIQLAFTRNLQGTDAYDEQVHCATVLVYDENGNFVEKFDATGRPVITTGLLPGNYHAVAYGGMNCDEADFLFNIPTGEAHSYTSLETFINGTRAGESSKNLHAHFHGTADFTVRALDYGNADASIDFTKNTNNIRVELKYADNMPVAEQDFDVYITADNVVTDHQNALVPQGQDVTYRPFDNGTGTDDNGVPTAWTEFSTGRLTGDCNATLHVVRRYDGQEVVTLPLPAKLNTIRDKELPGATLQEYLDRQDRWTIDFTLDHIVDQYMVIDLKINNWTVVINDYDF